MTTRSSVQNYLCNYIRENMEDQYSFSAFVTAEKDSLGSITTIIII